MSAACGKAKARGDTPYYPANLAAAASCLQAHLSLNTYDKRDKPYLLSAGSEEKKAIWYKSKFKLLSQQF